MPRLWNFSAAYQTSPKLGDLVESFFPISVAHLQQNKFLLLLENHTYIKDDYFCYCFTWDLGREEQGRRADQVRLKISHTSF